MPDPVASGLETIVTLALAVEIVLVGLLVARRLRDAPDRAIPARPRHPGARR